LADDPWAAFSPQAAPSAGTAADPWGAFIHKAATPKAEPARRRRARDHRRSAAVSPGVPAVNEEVDRIARSANKNLIEPITHPIDTLTGIGRLGAGVAQYAGAPGEEYKADVDALAADYKKTYGSMEGFKNALVEDPVPLVSMPRWVSARYVALAAVRACCRVPPRVSRHRPRQELHDASQGHYGAVHGLASKCVRASDMTSPITF